MKFYYEGLQDATLTYDGTEDTGYPVTNLQDMNKNTYFKDTVTMGGNELVIDFGSARTCDYVALINYTAKASGAPNTPSLSVYYSDDNSTYTASTLTAADISASTATDYVGSFTSGSHRYWKLKIYDCDLAGDVDVEIPVVLLGSLFEPASNPSMGVEIENVYSVNAIQGQGGQRFTSLNHDTNERAVRYYWKYISSADKTKWESLRDEVKPGAEFAAYPMLVYDENSTYHYQRLAGPLTIREVAYNAYDLEITLLDEV